MERLLQALSQTSWNTTLTHPPPWLWACVTSVSRSDTDVDETTLSGVLVAYRLLGGFVSA
jgi:hypothetical protein